MNKLLSTAILMASINTFACPDISGKYNCPDMATEPMALGLDKIQFKKSPYLDMYSMKVEDQVLMFEVDSWNPAINPNTGDIDYNSQTTAECKDNQVTLTTKETIDDGEINITVSGSFVVTKTATGINLGINAEGEELYNTNCDLIK